MASTGPCCRAPLPKFQPALIAAVRLSPSVEPECVRTAWPRRSLRSTSKSSFDQLSWPLTHSPASPYQPRSEEHTSELQSLMRISYAVFCLKKKHINNTTAESHYIRQNQH